MNESGSVLRRVPRMVDRLLTHQISLGLGIACLCCLTSGAEERVEPTRDGETVVTTAEANQPI